MKKILVVVDNEVLYLKFIDIIKTNIFKNFEFDFMCSYKNDKLKTKIKGIDIKKEYKNLIYKYEKIISLHSKQIFPKELIENIDCINIHPGFNPYNRGWFPQVFSIINGLPCGVTVHFMDEKIDNGAIIYQEKVEILEWDTSETLYKKILDKELEIIKTKLIGILLTKKIDTLENNLGNMNSIEDFKKKCKINLDEKLTMRDAINKLRALTHGNFKNAYVELPEGKIYLKLNIEYVLNEK